MPPFQLSEVKPFRDHCHLGVHNVERRPGHPRALHPRHLCTLCIYLQCRVDAISPDATKTTTTRNNNSVQYIDIAQQQLQPLEPSHANATRERHSSGVLKFPRDRSEQVHVRQLGQPGLGMLAPVRGGRLHRERRGKDEGVLLETEAALWLR